MKISAYYKTVPEYDFFINSYNLYLHSGLKEFLAKYDYTNKKLSKDERHKVKHDLQVKVLNDLDSFNFFLVELTVALEMSLKGIALSKKLNIFSSRGGKIAKPDELDPTSARTYELGFFLDFLKELLPSTHQKHSEAFRFFQKRRNGYIHFPKRTYNHNFDEIIKNLTSLNTFFEKVIIPLKEKASKRVS